MERVLQLMDEVDELVIFAARAVPASVRISTIGVLLGMTFTGFLLLF